MKKCDDRGRAVIMCGISGSGKTYHALRLEAEGYVRLSVDALVWDRVGKSLFELPGEKQKRLFDECKKEVRDKLVEHLKSGGKVVLDATNCRRSVRDDIRNLCEREGLKPLFVYCEADEEELWRRLSQRKGSGPDDLIVTRDELSRYYRGFERPHQDETDFTDIDNLIQSETQL